VRLDGPHQSERGVRMRVLAVGYVPSTRALYCWARPRTDAMKGEAQGGSPWIPRGLRKWNGTGPTWSGRDRSSRRPCATVSVNPHSVRRLLTTPGAGCGHKPQIPWKRPMSLPLPGRPFGVRSTQPPIWTALNEFARSCSRKKHFTRRNREVLPSRVRGIPLGSRFQGER
jgi:hypothetical protein